MADPSEIVPQGNLGEKYRPVREDKQAKRIEMALVALVVLFVLAVFLMLILGSFMSLDTANKALPAPVVTPK